VLVQYDVGVECEVAFFSPTTSDAVVFSWVFDEPLLAAKNIATDFAGRVAQVNVKVIVGGSFIGKWFLTQAAIEAPIDFGNVFGPHRYRSNQSRGGWDRGVACKYQEVLASH
jgi:hypothetical protein